MDIFYIRIASVIVIALVYMLFDVFNRRNVPTIFAYATLAYGAFLTLFYPSGSIILESAAIAMVTLGVGYVVYKIGQLGAADVIEFAALSLMLPLQPSPFFPGMPNQFGMPMIISVLVSAGMASLILVPLYYLPRAKRMLKRPLLSMVDGRSLVKASLITCSYLVFITFMLSVLRIQLIGALVLITMLVFSTLLITFERPITDSMVQYVNYKDFEEGDIIAFNLMGKREIAEIKRKAKGFTRLVTLPLIKEMKAKAANVKVPVYKDAVPLALPIFIGVVVSLTLGNLIFFILP